MQTTPSFAAVPDESNWRLLKTKTNSGFTWLYITYWDELTRLSCYYVKDAIAAEDIVQQLFIDMYSKDFAISAPANMRAYLRRAIRNRAYNYIASSSCYRFHINRSYKETAETLYNPVEGQMNLRDQQNKLSFLLTKMSVSCRTVFLLNREEQLTIKQIAARLQKSEDTVAKQLSRAVRFLHSQMCKPRQLAKEAAACEA
jgi:RNA polymerase sigma-70 factor (ECF subfamily)